MTARLPLSVLLLAIAGLDLAAGSPNLPLAMTGLAVGLALAATWAIDRFWRRHPGVPGTP